MPYHEVPLFTGSRGSQGRVSGPSRAGESVSGQVTKLDIAELVLTVCELFTAGLAETTQRVYKSGIWKYKDFFASWWRGTHYHFLKMGCVCLLRICIELGKGKLR